MKFKSTDYTEMREHYPEFDINTSRNANTIARLYNQKFNHLTALYPSHHNNRLVWVCQCDCGQYTVYSTDKLLSGEATTCGSSCVYKKSKMHDLTGQRFGRLTVIKRAGTGPDGHVTWQCKCDCGNEHIVLGRYLESGKISSCGRCPSWSTHSKGEMIISDWLIQHQIPFEREKTFEDCKRGCRLRYDFFLPTFNTLIEYQGIQHFKPTGGWFDEAAVLDCQERDAIKQQYASQHQIPLLIITYTDDIIGKLNAYLQQL